MENKGAKKMVATLIVALKGLPDAQTSFLLMQIKT